MSAVDITLATCKHMHHLLTKHSHSETWYICIVCAVYKSQNIQAFTYNYLMDQGQRNQHHYEVIHQVKNIRMAMQPLRQQFNVHGDVDGKEICSIVREKQSSTHW